MLLSILGIVKMFLIAPILRREEAPCIFQNVKEKRHLHTQTNGDMMIYLEYFVLILTIQRPFYPIKYSSSSSNKWVQNTLPVPTNVTIAIKNNCNCRHVCHVCMDVHKCELCPSRVQVLVLGLISVISWDGMVPEWYNQHEPKQLETTKIKNNYSSPTQCIPIVGTHSQWLRWNR